MAETAEMLGLPVVVDTVWADQDFGHWAGRSLDELAASEPTALRQWLGDPDFAPGGGESLTALVTRIGRALDAPHPDGLTVVVSSPAVVRACVVAALGAAPRACHRVDVAPLDAAEVNVNAGRVALRRLRPYPQWLTGRRPASGRGATRRNPPPPGPSRR
jgi:broad specificity phosphatase PhoE